MKTALINFAIVLLLVLGMQQQVAARPNLNNRVKRVSDQHFADLKTRVALHNIDGIAITIPVAGGRDLDRIGRKRRSESRLLESLFNQSEEEEGDARENERRLFDRTYDDLLYNYDK